MLIKTSIKPVIMATATLLIASGLFLIPSDSMANYIKFHVSPDAQQIYCHFKIVRKDCDSRACLGKEPWSPKVKAGRSYSATVPLLKGVIVSCNPYEPQSGIPPTGHLCITPSAEYEVYIANNTIVFSGINPANIPQCPFKWR